MVVWGGEIRGDDVRGMVSLGTGGQYNPRTDAWTPVSTLDAPSARDDHCAVWTGEEMIVWGGNALPREGMLLATGARYRPSTDQWAPMRRSPLSPRDDPTAVWSGAAMIIWGGRAQLETYGGKADALGRGARRTVRTHVATGARYEPHTDTWTPVTNLDAPTPREDHTAVWTGDEMIVWGGWSGDDGARRYRSDGGRYDPKADAWRPVSTTGAPSFREDHTAVWTGTAMIVWGGVVRGGDGALIQLNSGARYDPREDHWRAMSTRDAPRPREDHVALWVDGALVVWGGRHGDEALGDGAAYDPRTDRWRTLDPEAMRPAPRSKHAAVDTGAEILVWGGVGDGYDFPGFRIQHAIPPGAASRLSTR